MERLKIQSLLSASQLHRPELHLANTGQPNKVFPPPPSPLKQLKQRDTSFYLNWHFPELLGSLISTHQVLQYSHRGGRKLTVPYFVDLDSLQARVCCSFCVSRGLSCGTQHVTTATLRKTILTFSAWKNTQVCSSCVIQSAPLIRSCHQPALCTVYCISDQILMIINNLLQHSWTPEDASQRHVVSVLMMSS